MARKLFAILSPDGALITTTSGSLGDAVGEAAAISGNVNSVLVDGTAEASEVLQPNESLAQLRRKDEPIGGVQLNAYKWAMLPGEDRRPTTQWPLVTGEQMLFYMNNPRAAWEELNALFPREKWVKKHKRWQRISVYDTPAGLAKSFIGQNSKTAKEDPNAKLARTLLHKGRRGKIVTAGLSLLPAQVAWGIDPKEKPAIEVPNTCVGSSPECRAACLVYTGHNEIDKYNKEVKMARMKALYKNPAAFIGLLAYEVERRRRTHRPRGIYDFLRFNVFSDLPWELMCPDLFEYFKDTQFYDYTKVRGRAVPENYDLTFSFSGTNETACKNELAAGRRVAVVFVSGPEKEGRFGARKEMQFGQAKMFWPLPERFFGHQLVNGDFSDARPCDPVNAESRVPCVVGLHYKIPALLGERLEGGLQSFLVEAFKESDPRQSGYQRFREWYTGRRKGGMKPNPSMSLPTIVTQVHEIDGWLCVAGTPVQEGADDWHED